MKYLIPEYIWDQIFIILRQQSALYIRSESSLRLFIEAVHFMARSGCQWRLLPSHYGSWNSIYKRFRRWQKKGIWENILQLSKTEPDTEYLMIDATIIRAHACAAGYEKDGNQKNALGRSAGGFSTKIHALCDSLGNPLKFILTQGQVHDVTQAESLIENVKGVHILADKGYDSDDFVKTIEQQGCFALIPPRKNRKLKRAYDKHIYKERHLIECFFGKMKHFRRVFSRFDKASTSFMAFLNFVGALIWLR